MIWFRVDVSGVLLWQSLCLYNQHLIWKKFLQLINVFSVFCFSLIVCDTAQTWQLYYNFVNKPSPLSFCFGNGDCWHYPPEYFPFFRFSKLMHGYRWPTDWHAIIFSLQRRVNTKYYTASLVSCHIKKKTWEKLST